jgi:hypothetical protein
MTLFDPTELFHSLSLTLVVAAIKIMAACVNDRDDAPLGPEWHQLAGGGKAMCRQVTRSSRLLRRLQRISVVAPRRKFCGSCGYCVIYASGRSGLPSSIHF